MEISRRKFIVKLAVTSAGVGSLLFVSSCGNNDTEKEKVENDSSSEDPCHENDLTEAQKTSRNQFEYVHKSPHPEKRCNNCQLWIEPNEGEFCGGCQIIDGSINPKGYCNQWIKSV